MLYRICIFHSQQLTSMFCHFPEMCALKRLIHGGKAQPPQGAASKSHPQTTVASREFPPSTLLYSGCSLPVSGQAVFWGVTWLQRHHQIPKLCVGCQQGQVRWKGGGTQGTEPAVSTQRPPHSPRAEREL